MFPDNQNIRGARVIVAADGYHAMTGDRPERAAALDRDFREFANHANSGPACPRDVMRGAPFACRASLYS